MVWGRVSGTSGTSPDKFHISKVAQEPNRNRKPEPSEPFFPEPKAELEPPEPFSRNRKLELEPSFPVKNVLKYRKRKTFLQRNRWNRKPEPIEPFHPPTVTEPNRTGAILGLVEIHSQKRINSVQTRCIVKGEAQKSPLFW